MNNFKIKFTRPKITKAAKERNRIQRNQDLEQSLKPILGRIVERGDSVDTKDDLGDAGLRLIAQYLGDDRMPNVPKVKTFDQAYHLPLNSAGALAIARLFLETGPDVNTRV